MTKEKVGERNRAFEKQAGRADKPKRTATPLVIWSGRLTAEGETLAAWLSAQGRREPPPVGLIGGWASWFMKEPAQAAALWADYERARVEVRL